MKIAYSLKAKKEVTGETIKSYRVQRNVSENGMTYICDRYGSYKDFKCPSCGIELSCKNFGGKGKRGIFFQRSSDTIYHAPDCNYADKEENKKSLENEYVLLKRTVEAGDEINIIPLVQNNNENRNNLGTGSIEPTVDNSNRHLYQHSTTNVENKTSNISALKNIVRLYHDKCVNNEKVIVNLGNEKITLNEFFINLDNGVRPIVELIKREGNYLRIFYSNPTVEISDKKFVVIKHKHYNVIPPFRTTVNAVKKAHHLPPILEYEDQEKCPTVYFRGFVVDKETKSGYKIPNNNKELDWVEYLFSFKPYNTNYYNDLYIET